jgi:hypothetical protein
MKKILFLAGIAGSLALSSFTSATVDANNNEEIPYYEVIPNPCTGESVTATGTMHINTHTTINGNKLSYMMHINLQDLKGVAEDGTEYSGNYVDNEKYNLDFAGAYEKTVKVKAVLTTAGGGNNLIITQDLHFKITADGVVKSDVSNSQVVCQ